MIATMPIHVMAKPTGSTCNLACTYCYYVTKEAACGRDGWMSDALLETYVRQVLAAHPAGEVPFAWQGGEPTLMGIGFFRTAVALQEHYRRPEQRVVNALQTNGVLLDDAWGAFLHQHGFLVGISLDGPGELHDRQRRDRGGEPTFTRVLTGLAVLRRHRVEYNILCTITAATMAHGATIYRYLRTQGVHLQFIPVVERSGDPDPSWDDRTVAPWSVTPDGFGRFLNDVFDCWHAEDIGRIFVQTFEVQLGLALGLPAGLCIFAETCGNAVALERDGTVYACDHYVYPAFALGNLQEQDLTTIVQQPRQQAFGRAKRETLPACCRACSDLHRCRGECPKHRFVPTTAGEPHVSYLCPGYRAFFAHCRDRLDALASDLRRGRLPAPRPPANNKRVGPNDPCPCGSGRKAKRCCRSI